MSTYVVYNNIGMIVKALDVNKRDALLNIGVDEHLLVGVADDINQYVNIGDTPVIEDRPINTTLIDNVDVVADGVDVVTLSNVPIGSTITLGTISGINDTSTVTLVFDVVGTYKLKVELFPYLPYEVSINAT